MEDREILMELEEKCQKVEQLIKKVRFTEKYRQMMVNASVFSGKEERMFAEISDQLAEKLNPCNETFVTYLRNPKVWLDETDVLVEKLEILITKIDWETK